MAKYVVESGSSSSGATSKRPYDAMVYIDGTSVIAVDSEGNTIKRGVAGTDDASVINSGISILPTNGSIILKGNFVLEATITLKSNILVKIDGEISGITNYTFNFFTLIALNNVTIEGGYFSGDGDTNPELPMPDDANHNGIYFNYNSDITSGHNIIIRNITFHNMVKCIGFWALRYGSIIENCYCDKAKWYHIHGHGAIGTKISNNTCLQTTSDCAFSFWSETKDCDIIGNISISSKRYGIQLYYSGPGNIYYADGVRILNNYILSSDSHGIRIYSNGNERPIVVSGNIIKSAVGSGLYINGTSVKCVASDNTIISPSSGSGIEFNNALMININNNYILSPSSMGIGGTTNVTDCILSNNKIYSATTNGIQVGATNLIIDSNLVNTCGGYGIYAISCTNTYIMNNNISNQTSYGMRIRSLTNAYISNNFIGTSGSTGIYIDADATNVYARENVINSAVSFGGTVANLKDCLHNLGYITESTGTAATITAGNTYVDVTHSLAATPTKVRVTPTTNLGTRSFWVDTKGAATFRININSSDVIDHTFDWEAEV